MLVSVVMSIYKEELEWVKQAVDSILNQTYKELEFIIVVDNPQIDSRTKDYLEDLSKNKSVRILFNEQNVGLACSLNRGIEVSSGSLIARMDADDIAFKNRIETEVKYLINNHVDVVSCRCIHINEAGEQISKSSKIPVNPENLLRIGNCVLHPGALIKKNALANVNGYRNFKQSQDYDLWLRMLDNGYKINIINENLMYYRVRQENISNKYKYKQFMTARYIIGLSKERRKKGKDSFDEKDIERYFVKNKCDDLNNNEKFKRACEYIITSFEALASKRILRFIKNILRGIVTDTKVFLYIKYFVSYQLVKRKSMNDK